MSYAFSLRAPTRAAVKEKAATEFDKAVRGQAVHMRDREPVLAAVSAFVDLLVADDEEKDIYLSVNGAVSWAIALEPGGEATLPLTSVSVSINAYHVHRETQPQPSA